MDGVRRELQGRWPDHSAEISFLSPNTDRENTDPTGTQRIGDADAVAARQRGGDQRQHLVPRVGPPRRTAEVEEMVGEFPKAQVFGEGGR